MPRSLLGRAIVSGLVILIAGTTFWVLVATIIEALGRSVARDYASQHDLQGNPEEAAVALTGRVFEAFSAPTSEMSPPLLLRLRPFLTHWSLPAALSVTPGAIDAMFLNGHCDDAARSLAFVLSANGLPAHEVNLIGKDGQAHTIVRADLGSGRGILLDPHTGLVPFDDGNPVGERRAKQLQQEGVDPREIWRRVSKHAVFHPIFKSFQDIELTRPGADFEWRVTLDMSDRDQLILGEIDGSPRGTGDATAREGLGTYWSYLGHRFDRGWTRRLTVAQPTRVSFILVESARKGVITSDIQPKIEGRTVTYVLKKGQTLSLHDGRATIDLLALKSYIDVDAIRLENLSGEAGSN
jgi:hypothetical protein